MVYSRPFLDQAPFIAEAEDVDQVSRDTGKILLLHAGCWNLATMDLARQMHATGVADLGPA